MSERCEICKNNDSVNDPSHLNSEDHRFQFLLFSWRKYRRALVKDRHGIEISMKVDSPFELEYNRNLGNHTCSLTPEQLDSIGNQQTFECTINNISQNDMMLVMAKFLHPFDYFSLEDSNLIDNKHLQLLPGASYTTTIKFSSSETTPIGNLKNSIVFQFQTLEKDTFNIARSIEISVGAPEAVLDPVKSPFTNNEWPKNIEIVPPSQSPKYVEKYLIPHEYRRLIERGLNEYPGMPPSDYEILRRLRLIMENREATIRTYGNYWHMVLWLDEMAQYKGIQNYNMECITAKRLTENQCLEIEVQGLAEKRPSVVVSDNVEVRIHEGSIAYRGVVKRVGDTTIEIGHLNQHLLDIIRKKPEIELDVRFVLNRLALMRMHEGIDEMIISGHLNRIFPTANLQTRSPHTVILKDEDYLNANVRDNPEQRTAISKILNCSSGIAPFIIFGPPGTGKTVTLVESILQLKRKTPNNILVCAPANAACDMLTEKLSMHCKKSELIRIMAESVDIRSINNRVLDYSNFGTDGRFQKISPDNLKDYRIIVTTLILIGRYRGKYEPDVIFIDEAAQACEPEVSCAISMLKGRRIVLAGDPKQLGPVTSSLVAQKYQLDKSILERLLELDMYKNNENCIVMLRRNFRSHKMILKIPNKYFYDNLLQAVSLWAANDPLVKVRIYDLIQASYGKKNKKINQDGYAIEFYNTLSKEQRQGKSPSYFNQKEIQVVVQYVAALMSMKLPEDYEMKQCDIGVVTPYIRQVHKIKDALGYKNFKDVEVGTTEAFQGREKRVIIISTVRAQKNLLLYDKKYNLGFVSNEKRFNVAITRAKSKLIIVGCAQVLDTDSKWSELMSECINAKTFGGAPYMPRTKEQKDEITKRFNQVKFTDDQYNSRA